MNPEELINALKHKFEITTDKELIEKLGITYATLNSWRNRTKDISPSKIANFIHRTVSKCEKEARLYSIRPIVEYYPVNPGESARKAKWELFEGIENKNQRHEKIKESLKKSNGVYIFYDSQCKALYVGKAKEQNLWQEMNNAFNRERETQRLFTVAHPTTGQNFTPAHKQPRQIQKAYFYLHELSFYFSAYEVEKDLIDNIEAMLVRSFSNTILNARMEKIKTKS
jgi:hypothetical protein